jgi:hypothetical protein
MKIVIRLLILATVVSMSLPAQEKVIDFRYTDAKGLTPSQLQEWSASRDRFFARMDKTTGYMAEIKSLVIQGNKIKTIIYNTSSISRPGITPNVLDLVWNGLGYGYEFGPLVGAKVPKAGSLTDSVKIVSEGFYSSSDGEYSPNGAVKWGWLPKAGYSAPGQPDIASWGARSKVGNDLRLRPPSWPESWYNPILGQYVYPSYLGGNSTVPDEEVYFVDDDWTKAEWAYYPFPDDSTKRGLGMNLEVRTFQYSNPLAQDIIFLVYTAENASPKTLGKVYFGMFGDPHIGGANNYSDDAASFIPAREGQWSKNGVDLTHVNGVLTSARSRNIVYAWDPDNKSDIPSIPPGYFGYKFLESPTNSNDGIDNDDDGIIDESPFNDKGTYIDGVTVPLTTGIANLAKYKAMYGDPKPRWSGDENGNWDPTRDDVGIDGIPGTGDYGEGNGVPDQEFAADGTWLGSEPNFGFRDVNESDQIGLNSFWALVFGGDNRPKNDILMYDKLSGMDSTALDLLYPPTMGDNIFLYGSGPFQLKHGDRQRFSIALMMAANLSDLLLHSETAQRVLEANYRFAQPPPKPHVVAVPGNKRVTLYWDTAAEEGIDPLLNVNDFEGYKVYRSEDYTFSDVFTITDGNGTPFLGKALTGAQWHTPWSDSLKAVYVGGFHPAEFQGRFVKYYMGDPADMSGLRHEFVDSTVTNGKTYYYAVVAFDHGSYTSSLQLPPTETQATITRDAVTQEYKFDVNTLSVVPGAQASGVVSSAADIAAGITTTHAKGNATGTMQFQVLNEKALTNGSFNVSFKKIKSGSDSVIAYSILHASPVTETITGRDLLYAGLQNRNVVKSSVQVFDASNVAISPALIVVDSAGGQIKGTQAGVLKSGSTYTVSYQYYPILNSIALAGQDYNPVFDGIRPFVTDEAMAIDSTRSTFQGVKPTGVIATVDKASVGTARLAPLDVKITFYKALGDTTASGAYTSPVDSVKDNTQKAYVKVPFKIENATDTTKFTVLIKESSTGVKGRWDVGDEIIVLTPPPYNLTSTNTMMGIIFKPSSTVAGAAAPVIPAGTIYLAKVKKPFTVSDAYTITTQAISIDPAKSNAAMANIYAVPNPYVASSQFELPGNRPDLRGDRVIQFRNLPAECTIRIYTITGELVQTLHKNDSSGYLNWDVLTSESQRLAYGVYIFHVESPLGGTKIGRLAIIK